MTSLASLDLEDLRFSTFDSFWWFSTFWCLLPVFSLQHHVHVPDVVVLLVVDIDPMLIYRVFFGVHPVRKWSDTNRMDIVNRLDFDEFERGNAFWCSVYKIGESTD